MDRDIRKFSAWLEEALRVGIAEEKKLLEWKIAEKNKPTEKPVELEDLLKAS